jgi:hypothetical protein
MNQDKDYIVKEDMICPVTKEHCDDECCPVGAWCNLMSDGIYPNYKQPIENQSENKLNKQQ